MRTIKFRGKDLQTGEWVYGHYTQGGFFTPDTEEMKTRHLIHADFLHDVEPETVGQFTGLHDKNGKEIYEGDICKCNGVFKIIWYDDWCRFAVVSANGCLFYNVEKDSAKYWEVIGNCHDNPELLTT